MSGNEGAKKKEKVPGISDRIDKTLISSIDKIETGKKKAIILFLSGPLLGKVHMLEQGLTTMGRSPNSDIMINDSRISRHHLQIIVKGEEVVIEDLGSTNGTFVNGKRIKTPQTLHDGDKIQISSSTVFKFALQDKTENIFQEELYKMAVVDPVTGAYNKRFFLDRLEEEFSHSKRAKIPLSLLMIDLDFFKKVNDAHGHLAGDFVLFQLVKIFKTMIRMEDILARYGGEEFSIILRNTSEEGAYFLAERIRSAVASQPLKFEDNDIPVTISIGIAVLDERHDFNTIKEFIEMADKNLYHSKEHGRNKTTSPSHMP